jgi:DNA-directed RNA polymerase subunit RPC12/RpoP
MSRELGESLDGMADGEAEEPENEIVCPHCKKRFSADLMAGSAERYRGFKCPHCRLFVPAARING